MHPSPAVTARRPPWRRFLLLLTVLLLALGVLGMHSLRGGHHGAAPAPVHHLGTPDLGAVGAVAASGAPAATAVHDHGAGRLEAVAGAVAAVVGDLAPHGPGGTGGEDCAGGCHEAALLAGCLAVLVIVVALAATRARAWTSLPATVWASAPLLLLLLPRTVVVPRLPVRFLLCISRT